MNNSETLFEAFLNQHDGQAWAAAIKSLMPSIHEVDKTATEIWFAFYPLDLARALQQSSEAEKLAQRLLLQGKYLLKDQIDSSHQFLYGHRYWPDVKKAAVDHATSAKAPASLDLTAQIREVAEKVAGQVKADRSLLVGITAVAFMTLQQVGLNAFKNAAGTINLDKSVMKKTPEQILQTRTKDDDQGIFGFLRTVDKRYSVTFNENDSKAKYTLIDSQDLTTAAANDKRDYRKNDPRCIEGPIPVECRAGSCGTCWVGIVAGGDKLEPVGKREATKIKEYGYINTDNPRPAIRLACLSIAHGAVSIVIPPWNGQFGKYLQSLKSETVESVKAEK